MSNRSRLPCLAGRKSARANYAKLLYCSELADMCFFWRCARRGRMRMVRHFRACLPNPIWVAVGQNLCVMRPDLVYGGILANIVYGGASTVDVSLCPHSATAKLRLLVLRFTSYVPCPSFFTLISCFAGCHWRWWWNSQRWPRESHV